MEFDKVLDNGDRQEFDTGSKRDTAEGKGTPHLIAGEVMADISKTGNSLLNDIQSILFAYCAPQDDRYFVGNIEMAARLSLRFLMEEEDNKCYLAMRRFARHYENGAKKYGDNNWRKGQPISRFYDSAMRHLWQLIDKNQEEDHASALLWNLTCILQTKKDIKRGHLPESLNDFPYSKEELFGKR